MQKKQGFTVLELLVAVAIIAILSASLSAKYVQLARDARIVSLQGVKAAMGATARLVQLKAKHQGIENGDLTLGHDVVLVDNGYIAGHWNLAWQHALYVGQEITFTPASATCSKNALCGVGYQVTAKGLPESLDLTGNRGLVLVWFEGDTLDEQCYAFYYNPGVSNEVDGGDDTPTIGTVTDGC